MSCPAWSELYRNLQACDDRGLTWVISVSVFLVLLFVLVFFFFFFLCLFVVTMCAACGFSLHCVDG